MPDLDFERLSPLLEAAAVAMRALSVAALKAQAVIVGSPYSTANELRKAQQDVSAMLSYQAELVDLVQLSRYALSLSVPPELQGWQSARAVAAVEAIRGAETKISDADNGHRVVSANMTAFLEAIISDEPIPEAHQRVLANFANIAKGPEYFAAKIIAFCKILVSVPENENEEEGDEERDEEGDEEGEEGAVEYVSGPEESDDDKLEH